MHAFAQPSLQRLLALSMLRVQPLVDGIYGAHALLVAPDLEHLPTLSSPMSGLRLCGSGGATLRGDLRAHAGELPLHSDSMALIMLQYALHGDEGEALLAEAARVLAPEGVALVVGINRMSAWNLLSRRHGAGRAPGASACRRVLAQCDVETLQVRHFGPLLPPLSAGPMPATAQEGRWLGPLRASFLVIARKRRAQATPLRFARLDRSRAVSHGLAGSFRKVG